MTRMDARFAQRNEESKSIGNVAMCGMLRKSAERIRNLLDGHLKDLTETDKRAELNEIADDVDFLGAILRERIFELRRESFRTGDDTDV